jgi:hypothetical protein
MVRRPPRSTPKTSLLPFTALFRCRSTISAGSSIGLTIPDAVCIVLCSWCWAEEPPETCRAIHRNKYVEKTLHLVGCTLEIYLRCTDIWRSNFKKTTLRKLSGRLPSGNNLDISDAEWTGMAPNSVQYHSWVLAVLHFSWSDANTKGQRVYKLIRVYEPRPN